MFPLNFGMFLWHHFCLQHVPLDNETDDNEDSLQEKNLNHLCATLEISDCEIIFFSFFTPSA